MTIKKLSYLYLIMFLFPVLIQAETYKDTQGYKDYLKLPDKYKSPAMEAMYKDAYKAKQKVINIPCGKGGTIGEYLDKKANIPAVEDLGWAISPYQGGYEVERLMMLGDMKQIYRWSVDSNGIIKAVNGKAMSLTK